MASSGNIWWMTPLQAFATLGAAINFGGSTLQSPLIMPMLQLESVPAVYAGKQTTYLLHNSEKFFPPLNLACTIANLVLTITAYLKRNSSREAAAKLPFVAIAFVMSVATTGYALGIMVPMNKRMAVLGQKLEKDTSDVQSEKELRQLQKKWSGLNYGRASLMIGSAIIAVRLRFRLTAVLGVGCIAPVDLVGCIIDCFSTLISSYIAVGRWRATKQEGVLPLNSLASRDENTQ